MFSLMFLPVLCRKQCLHECIEHRMFMFQDIKYKGKTDNFSNFRSGQRILKPFSGSSSLTIVSTLHWNHCICVVTPTPPTSMGTFCDGSLLPPGLGFSGLSILTSVWAHCIIHTHIQIQTIFEVISFSGYLLDQNPSPF